MMSTDEQIIHKEEDQWEDWLPGVVRRIAVPIYVLGIVGNVLVILTILLIKSQRKRPSRQPVLSLAISNVLVIVTALCLVFFQPSSSLLASHLMDFSFLYMSVCSAGNLVAIAVDRYYAESRSNESMKRSVLFVVVTWILSLIVSLGYKSIDAFYDYCDQMELCNYSTESLMEIEQETNMWLIKTLCRGCEVLIFMIVLIAMTAVILILRYLNHTLSNGPIDYQALRRSDQCSRPSVSLTDRIARNCKTMKTLVLIGVIFVLCWTPTIVYDLCYDEDNVPVLVQLLAAYLTVFNSCVNAVIYSLVSSNFRKSFKQVLSCSVRSENKRQSESKWSMSTN